MLFLGPNWPCHFLYCKEKAVSQQVACTTFFNSYMYDAAFCNVLATSAKRVPSTTKAATFSLPDLNPSYLFDLYSRNSRLGIMNLV